MTKQSWEKRFKDEFGIHFKDSSGELQFAITFIEELLDTAREEERKKIKADLNNDYLGTFNDAFATGFHEGESKYKQTLLKKIEKKVGNKLVDSSYIKKLIEE